MLRGAAAAVLCALGLTAGATACHAERLTKREYVAEMRSLFANAQRRALREWPDVYCDRAVSRRDWLAQMQRALRADDELARRMRRLRPPARVARAHAALLEYFSATRARTERVTAVVAAGELDPHRAAARFGAMSPADEALFHEAIELFHRARYDVFRGFASGWTGAPPPPPGC